MSLGACAELWRCMMVAMGRIVGMHSVVDSIPALFGRRSGLTDPCISTEYFFLGDAGRYAASHPPPNMPKQGTAQ